MLHRVLVAGLSASEVDTIARCFAPTHLVEALTILFDGHTVAPVETKAAYSMLRKWTSTSESLQAKLAPLVKKEVLSAVEEEEERKKS